jgi:3-oxoadipate enol-lactonase/4-carboxymuconolactone decarboxylase
MFMHANGIDIHVQIDGPPGAPALLLIHSLGTSLHVWDDQARALSRSFRVIRADLRGHGLTQLVSGPGSIATYAQDMLAVLDALQIDHAHVAGLSIGGLVAQSVAAQAPDRVMSLILCDTAMMIPPPEGWHGRAAAVRAGGMAVLADAVMARWITPGFAGSPQAAGLRAMLLRTLPEGYAGAAEAIAAADLTASTSALTLPALIMVGDQDQATPVSSAEAMHAAIAGSRLVILPNAAHLPTVETPDAVTQAISAFLRSLVANHDGADHHSAGMAIRREVLGAAHVDRAIANTTAFDAAFQHFITRTAWGGVWARGGLDRRTRSLLTIALMAALGHHEELKLHVRASRNTGATAEDIAEVMIQVAAYAGIPAANSAVRIAKETLREMDT